MIILVQLIFQKSYVTCKNKVHKVEISFSKGNSTGKKSPHGVCDKQRAASRNFHKTIAEDNL